MKDEAVIKFMKVAMTLCVVFGMLSLVIFVPQVREIIIGFGESAVGHPLNQLSKALIGLEVLFLVIVAAAFMLFKLIAFVFQQHTDVYTLFQSKLRTVTDDAWAHYVALAVFVLVLCVLHFCLAPSGDDVNYFNHALQGTTYLDFLKTRYETWSSRLIIETVLINCYALNFGLWRVLDVAALVVIAESLVYICVPQKRYAVFVYTVILLCTDWLAFKPAGWGATTVNYLWPLAASMPMLLLPKR